MKPYTIMDSVCPICDVVFGKHKIKKKWFAKGNIRRCAGVLELYGLMYKRFEEKLDGIPK